MVFLFVLGYIINYAENFIPYNIIPRARLNNPNKFNTDYVYDEVNDFSSEECAARGLIVTGNRLIHPFLSLFVAGLKLVFIAGCVVLLVIVLRKINRKHRNKEILDTPMKDLVAEHAEDIRDKYE